MDYLSNLLVGPTNKLKTAGVILGSVCVGIIGIVSAAFISYAIIDAATTSTSTVTVTDITPPIFSITSSNPNVTITASAYTPASQTDIGLIINGTSDSNQLSWGQVSFNATVPPSSSILFDIILPLTSCANLAIYKYYNGIMYPNKATNINNQTCSFSINITDNGFGDSNNESGIIADPLIFSYTDSMTLEVFKGYATAASLPPYSQSAALNALEFIATKYLNGNFALNAISDVGIVLTVLGQPKGTVLPYGINISTISDEIDEINVTVAADIAYAVTYYSTLAESNYNTSIDSLYVAAAGKTNMSVLAAYNNTPANIKSAYTCAAGLIYLGLYELIKSALSSITIIRPTLNNDTLGKATNKIATTTIATTNQYTIFQSYATAAKNPPYNQSMALAAYIFIQGVSITNDNIKALVVA